MYSLNWTCSRMNIDQQNDTFPVRFLLIVWTIKIPFLLSDLYMYLVISNTFLSEIKSWVGMEKPSGRQQNSRCPYSLTNALYRQFRRFFCFEDWFQTTACRHLRF